MIDHTFIILTFVNILLLLALSFNLTAGYLGYVNMASGAFYGTGSYITALLMTNMDWNFFGTLPVSVLGGVGVAIITGLPSLRVRGVYFIIISLAFQMLFFDLFRNLSLIGLSEQIRNIPRPKLFGIEFISPFSYWLLSCLIVAVVLVFTNKIINSPYGRLLRGIREDETILITQGKPVGLIKIQTFACSGAIAALAGS